MNTTIIFIGVLVLLVLFLVSQYNKLTRLNVGVDEGFAQIEVQLQRRSDLIPNLVETVKGYASHEADVLQKVVEARSAATGAQGFNEIAAADGSLTSALRGLLAITENYPDLKASANFIALQEELSATENKVGFARQYYNDRVRQLNQALVTIPTSFFASMAKVVKRDFYEVDSPEKRDVPKVSF
jgi:LemA protein